MFEGDSADMCAGKFPLVSMGGRVDPSSVRRRGVRTPIGASGNFTYSFDNYRLFDICMIVCLMFVFAFGDAHLHTFLNNPLQMKDAFHLCMTSKITQTFLSFLIFCVLVDT